jgi:hypothetical protein
MATILPFDSWKAQLQEDCQRMHKLLVLDRTGDYVLRLFWSNGMQPTVQGIINGAEFVEHVDHIPADFSTDWKQRLKERLGYEMPVLEFLVLALLMLMLFRMVERGLRKK